MKERVNSNIGSQGGVRSETGSSVLYVMFEVRIIHLQQGCESFHGDFDTVHYASSIDTTLSSEVRVCAQRDAFLKPYLA